MDLFEVEAKDFGPFEHMVLPLYKQGLVWVTGENKDTKAANNNGSGKTHIFKALSWGLYGESIDGEKGDKVIRHGAKKAEVTIKFGDDPERPWKLVRTRTKGAPRLSLINPDGNEHTSKRDEAQERIIEMLGLDFVAFRNTVYYGQLDITRFARPTTSDAERKNVLHKVARTGVLKICNVIAKDRAATLRKEVKALEEKVAQHRARIDEHDLDDLEDSHNDWEDDRVGEIEGLKLEARKYKALAESEMESGDVDVSELEEENNGLSDSIDKGLAAETEMPTLEEKIEGAEESLGKKQRDLDRACDAIDGIEGSLGRLGGNECPTCTSPLNAGAAGEYVSKLKKQLLDAERSRDKCESARDKVENSLGKLRTKRAMLRRQIAEGRTATARRSEIAEEISEARAEAAQATSRAQHAVAMAKEKLKQAKAKAAETNPYAKRLSEAKSRVKQLTKQAEKVDSEATELRTELSHYEFWVKGFSDHGLPSFILDSVMPYLTERANHYLEVLSDGDITMEFTTQRELKSTKGEYRDEIDILWIIEGIEGYPPSGGQMKKMELATDFALMDLMATREGSHINLLMLDEVDDGLDDEGNQRVMMLLQKLRAERGTIYVISHSSNISEVFDKYVSAVKQDGVSKIMVAT